MIANILSTYLYSNCGFKLNVYLFLMKKKKTDYSAKCTYILKLIFYYIYLYISSINSKILLPRSLIK